MSAYKLEELKAAYPNAEVEVLEDDGYWMPSTCCDMCGNGMDPLILKQKGFLRVCELCDPEEQEKESK